MANITIHPLSDDLPFGARVTGATREAIADADVRQELNELFENRGVIVFEGMEPTAEMQVEISEVFGPLKDHPVDTVDRADRDKLLGVIEISTDAYPCIVEIDGKQLVTWQPWHFDHAYNDELNRAGVLRSLKIATDGGQTGFADGIQIYNDMDPAIRDKAEGLHLLYNLDLRYTEQKFGLPKTFRQIRPHDKDFIAMAASLPRSIHPVLWSRQTGEKVFHMTPYGCQGIEGSEKPEDFKLLQEIWDEAMRVIKPYYHSWKATDMVIWGNWRVLHEACGCNPAEERTVHRTTIKGDYGLGRFEQKSEVAADG
ncbi:MAG: TauD/TfdA family dioxygenase [Novosphingobium sp.]|nr:TauD/TfdA family dioxygenase [Novosphingobium sp.]